MYYNDKNNNTKLGSGTAFIIQYNNNYYLITNRHNVTGEDNNTGKIISSTRGVPNKLLVYFNHSGKLGSWISKPINLYNNFEDKKTHVWFEHPVFKNNADVVAFKLDPSNEINFAGYNLEDNLDIIILPSDPLNVVGFPFGKTAHGYFAIWSTGFLATDIDLPYDNLPIFLIDCRSRRGQSGSPVIIHRNKGSSYTDSKGVQYLGADMQTKLLGLYSGRINAESDLGMVWKLSVIKELIGSIK
jgi:S1-C subfamily serine protease